VDRPRSRPDPGSLEEGPGRVKPEVEFKKAPPDAGKGFAAPISGASYGNSTALTPLLSDEDWQQLNNISLYRGERKNISCKR